MNKIHASARVLSDGETEMIHGYSLRILDEIGIHTPNGEMLALLDKAGC
jgi:trimethylamine:corrinoid methyltransferase-like protein